MNEKEPFPGLEYFRTEDAELFFGRENETARLVARILSSAFTLLHAPSGAGKTSLLNASAIPDLEARGWSVVRTTVGDDPVLQLCNSTIDSLLPPPAAEAVAIRRCREALAGDVAADAISLEQIARRFDDCKDVWLRRELLTPVKLDVNGREIPYSTCFARFLRHGLSPDQFVAHVSALHGAEDLALNEESPLQVFESSLAGPMRGREAILEGLRAGGPADTRLLDFFTVLFDKYGSARTDFSLVIILDQFEELYTRYGENKDWKSQTPVLDWRLRDRFLDQLKKLFEHTWEGSTAVAPNDRRLPIRFVISMRKEFLAEVEPIRRFVADLDQRSFPLMWLTTDSARQAMARPAANGAVSYVTEFTDTVLKDLLEEGEYIQPAPLQVVCAALCSELRDVAGPEERWRFFHQDLKGVKGILGEALNKVLARIVEDAAKEQLGPWVRNEAVDILSSLTIDGKTRNIVDRIQLVQRPLRFSRVRERIMQQFEDSRITRQEQRHGRLKSEVTHEFLIESIRVEALKLENDSRWRAFRHAVDSLTQAARDKKAELEKLSVEPLIENAAWVNWLDDVYGQRSIQIMLRSILTHVENLKPETLAEWIAMCNAEARA